MPGRPDGAAVPPAYAGEPLGIIAAGGDLPRLVADRATRAGWRPVIVKVADAVGSDWPGFEAREFHWGRVGDAIDWLRRSGVRRLVSGGTVSRRPDFRSVMPSLATLRLLGEMLRVTRGGDDSALRRAARFLERRGFEVLAVQDIAPDLLMPRGLLTGRAPSADETAALRLAARAAKAIGAVDAGQAAVASKDRVVAMEGIEGTREMLTRVADLRRRGRIGPGEACVLVKRVKPGQDLRFDLPSIGAATVREAADAGLRGIGLTAGRGLVIGFDDLLAEAASRRVFVIGLDPDAEGAAP